MDDREYVEVFKGYYAGLTTRPGVERPRAAGRRATAGGG
jgi:hypothetical protein